MTIRLEASIDQLMKLYALLGNCQHGDKDMRELRRQCSDAIGEYEGAYVHYQPQYAVALHPMED